MGDSAFSRFTSWVVISVLSTAIAVLLTLGLSGVRTQFDLTEDSRFTLPKAAESIVSDLKDELTVSVYLSESLPSSLSHIPRILRRRLEELRSASGDKINFEFADPKDDPDLIAELKDIKVEPVQAQDMREGELVTGTYWLWLVFRYGDQVESFNLAELRQALSQSDLLLATLPYHLCARIVKVTNPDSKIGLIAEFKPVPQQMQRNFGQQPTALVTNLMKGIESHYPPVKQVNIKTGIAVPDDVKTLIVYRPEKMSDREVYEIDQFLMKGGSIIVMLDSFSTFDMERVAEFGPGLQAGAIPVREFEVGMKPWLEHFGVVMEKGFVEDRENAVFRAGQPRMVRTATGQIAIEKNEHDAPGFVIAKERGEDGPTGQFSSESGVFDGLGQVGMVLPAVLRIDASWKDRHPKAQLHELLRSSSESWVRKIENGRAKFYGNTPPERSQWGSFPLVVSMDGSFKSFWAGKERPARQGPDGKALPEGPKSPGKIDESANEGQLWVIADTEFCSDVWPGILQRASPEMLGAVQRMSGGVVNALDAMTLGSDLIKIRKPNLKDRSVKAKLIAKKEVKSHIRWIAVGLAPCIILGLGIIRLIARMVLTASPSVTPRKTAEQVLAQRMGAESSTEEISS